MQATWRIRAILLGLVMTGMAVSGAVAACTEFGGFAVFQCADKAYFAPPPFSVTLDPNNRATNVTAVFWQIGFGNQNRNDGTGTSGTGNSGTLATSFNGNDQGNFKTDVVSARAITGDTRIPSGALCLGNNNWGNLGVDGCCDNQRDAGGGMPGALTNDDFLNPYYNVYYGRNGSPGLYSLTWQQDYPMAVLMKDESGRYFAIAAVATMPRGNDGTGHDGACCRPSNFQCNPWWTWNGVDGCDSPGTLLPECTMGPAPGCYDPLSSTILCNPVADPNTYPPNPAPCDFRMGTYEFKRVSGGEMNATDPAQTNVVPWQEVPAPNIACTANCAGAGNRTINAQWTAVNLHSDQSVRPSTHPKMAPADSTRAAGVGVADVRAKFPLIRYRVQAAPVTSSNIDPNGRVIPQTLTWTDTGSEVSTAAATGLSVAPDSCLRVKVLFGKKAEVTAANTVPLNCRVGKCGDNGYETVRTDIGGITCVGGGGLFTETFSSVSAERRRGSVVVGWTMGAELTVSAYNVYVVTPKGSETLATAAPIQCKECNNGVSASYEYAIPSSRLKGARAVIVEALAQKVIRSNPAPVR